MLLSTNIGERGHFRRRFLDTPAGKFEGFQIDWGQSPLTHLTTGHRNSIFVSMLSVFILQSKQTGINCNFPGLA